MSRLRLAGPRGRFYTTYKFMRDPYSCYRRWKQDYGETFMVKALNGNVVATCNTENIRRTFAIPGKDLEQFAAETVKPLVGSQSLFLLEGEQHRQQRSQVSPCFYGERINNKAQEIQDVAIQSAKHWRPGNTVRIMETSLDVSLEVIIRVVFGVQSSARVQDFKKKIKKFVGAFHPVLAFSRLLHRPLFGLSPWKKFATARSELEQMLDQEIIKCRTEPVDEENMLSVMIHNSEDSKNANLRVRDQLVTMLLAGHETTQIAMAWAMSWLHRHSDILNQLRCELEVDNSIDSIVNSSLLDGVCNESLRLNAIVPDIVRKLRTPLEWVDCTLPVGTNVAIAICLVHEDPDIFPNPFQFDPARWSDREFKPHEFLPFGGGVRRCIGSPLAMLEMKIVVGTWIRHFVLSLPDDAPTVETTYRRNVTMAPRSGIPLKIISVNGLAGSSAA